MCKKILIGTIVSICLVFTGCSGGQPKQEEKQIAVKDTGMKAEISQKADNTSKEKEKAGTNSGLQVLSINCERNFMSETGYYYITGEEEELKDGTSGRHIMYMDFATKQEVYLCAEPGCKHNSKNCTAVLDCEEFGDTPLIFVCNDVLYIASRNSSFEGSQTITSLDEDLDLVGNGITMNVGAEMPAVLYSMGLDGTNRTKEYAFDQGINLNGVVLYDGKDLYFVANKTNISSDKSDKNTTYQTTSDYELVKYQTEDSKLVKVCSLEFGDDVRYNIEGCHNGNIILHGRKYNGNLTFEEKMNLGKEEGLKYESDSKEMYVKLDLTQGTIKEIYSIKNDPNSMNCVNMLGDYLYVSQEKTNTIEKVNIETGKIQKFVTLKQNSISGSLSNKLCCSSWDPEDKTIYFVDVDSGKIEHCTLLNHYNGLELEIIGETGDQVLVIYDWDAEETKDMKGTDVWEVKRKQYGLIDKKDLYQSKDRFKKIEMKGAGE